jgi:hypothetical protein
MVESSTTGDNVMAYTPIQKLRRMRAKNKGWNKKLAASMRFTVAWLERMGPEEFSRREIKDLQLLRKMLDPRLYMNAITNSHDELIANPEKFRVPSGGYSIDLDKKDL